MDTVRFVSEGYPALEIDLSDLAPRKEEENTSAALVRGVAAKIKELGYPLRGFDACANSTVLSGSGLSSSAAYEVLVGNIFNLFCCRGKLDAITIFPQKLPPAVPVTPPNWWRPLRKPKLSWAGTPSMQTWK